MGWLSYLLEELVHLSPVHVHGGVVGSDVVVVTLGLKDGFGLTFLKSAILGSYRMKGRKSVPGHLEVVVVNVGARLRGGGSRFSSHRSGHTHTRGQTDTKG